MRVNEMRGRTCVRCGKMFFGFDKEGKASDRNICLICLLHEENMRDAFGMRDVLALHAMTAMIQFPYMLDGFAPLRVFSPSNLATKAYEIADAMLNVRSSEKEGKEGEK